jgi:hypothetical protein
MRVVSVRKEIVKRESDDCLHLFGGALKQDKQWILKITHGDPKPGDGDLPAPIHTR